MIDSTAPSGSSCPSDGSRESGTKKIPRTMAMAQIGTFTRNTEPHEKCSSSKPPPKGPMTMPSPDTPAQMPIALARSRPTNVFVRIDNVVGKMSAPPMPMSPRAAISIAGDVANDANAENVANSTRPAVSAFLRPNRSPERSGREQQSGEHDRVRVDDPLELRIPSRRDPGRSTATRR